MKPLILDGKTLTAREVDEVARAHRSVRLDKSVNVDVDEGVACVRKAIASRKTVYGIDTGFGELASVSIGESDLATLQRNLVRSHAAAAGDPLPIEEVRAILVTKANGLLRKEEGVRWEVIELLTRFLELSIHPVIPSIGSLGASGDLAQLAHLALALIGEGDVVFEGRLQKASDAMKSERLQPVVLGPKEGLGLINGTQCIAAVLSLALRRARQVLQHAEIATVLSTEALRGTDEAWDARLFDARPHPGNKAVAARLRKMMRESGIRSSHLNCDRVQDAYSVRCAPVVLGSVSAVIERSLETVEIELNAATGNPLCDPATGDILSGGNFHGEPVAFAADFLGIALAEVGSIAERRMARLVDPKLSDLPAYLAVKPGLESGYMIAHYTAAALVSENKASAFPASVDSIPTSGNQEDHVSMGFHAARKARDIGNRVEQIVALELLLAAQGIEYLRPLESSGSIERVMSVIRERIPPLTGDRPVTPDLHTMVDIMRSNELVEAAGVHE